MMQARWEETLWDELDEMDPADQFVKTGEWITHLTQTLLTELANRRRLAVLKALAENGGDATRFAEEVGSRPTTITRLAEEGRAHLRGKDQSDGPLRSAE